MVVTFLGTSAANAYPLAFCHCGNCGRARELGGPSLRRRSSALIDDDLLIDLGPDIITGSFLAGRSLANVSYCLQTHSHADHLDPSHFEPRTPQWAVVGVPRLHFYASAATAARVAAHYEGFYEPADLRDQEVCERLNLEIHQIEALQSFPVGPYRVTAFPANHDPAVDPLLYAVEGEGRSIFYGVDTAALPEETWQAFHRYELQFDVVVLDHTYGPGLPGTDHLSADQFIEHAARLREESLLAEGARILATHISHEGNPPHPELTDSAARHGYEIAYDGLTV
jgi:phosphoribosyl 1,2-cyclic phosphate phosphodiesterase